MKAGVTLTGAMSWPFQSGTDLNFGWDFVLSNDTAFDSNKVASWWGATDLPNGQLALLQVITPLWICWYRIFDAATA